MFDKVIKFLLYSKAFSKKSARMSSSNDECTSNIYVGDYKDIDEYIESLQGWNVEISQLSKGTSKCSMKSIVCDHFSYLRFSILKKSEHFALADNKGLSFYISDQVANSLYLMGKNVPIDTICCTPQSGVIHVVTPDDYNGYTVSISYELIEQIASTLNYKNNRFIVPKTTRLFNISRFRFFNIQHWLKVIDTIESCDSFENEISHQAVKEIMMQKILPELVGLLTGDVESSQAQNSTLEIKHVNKILSLIRDNLDSPPTVADLANEVGQSQRNIQYLFKRHFSLTPKQYIKAVRLNAARKSIRKAENRRGVISEVANKFGFWHMGQFARDYQAQFGVQPRITLAK